MSLCCSITCPSASITSPAILNLLLCDFSVGVICHSQRETRPPLCLPRVRGRIKEGAIAWTWMSGIFTQCCVRMNDTDKLLQKNFLILFLLHFEIFFAKLIHLHEFDLVGVGEWRIDAFAIYELTGVRLNLHALVIEEEVDESFAGVRPRGFGS